MALQPYLECIPNVSEGRDLAIIEQLTEAIVSVPGTHLLHRDIGYDANRTVFTFVGSPAAVSLSAKQLATRCTELIDLRTYTGTHPYIGALDVCPFVALWGLDATEAHAAAKNTAQYIGQSLHVPVYFYEHSATRDLYNSLAQVRKGGLAALSTRPSELGPDIGTHPHATAGACVLGVRDILVAYNINLSTKDVEIAKAIAAKIRSMKTGTGLAKVRAIGWYQPTFGCAQVSVNLLDYRVTGFAEAYKAVREIAQTMGVEVRGSELIGLTPLEALVNAARVFTGKPADAGVDQHQAALLAVEALGLNAIRPFDIEDRVLEYAVGRINYSPSIA